MSKPSLLFLFLIIMFAFPATAESVTAGVYQIEVTTDPSPPIVGDNELHLSVTENGEPAADVQPSVTYDMVGMHMDMTPPVLTARGPGQFSGPLILGMPGLWKLKIQVNGPKGKAQGELTIKTGEGSAPPKSTSSSGVYQVEVITHPDQPSVGDIPTTIEVTKDGQPVNGATVFVGADMPGMSMGLRPAKAVEKENGQYEVSVPLSMEGMWKLTVEVDGAQGKETQQVSVVVGRGGSNIGGWLPWLLLAITIASAAVGLVRGWRPPLWQVVVLILLLLGAAALTRYANSRVPADKSMGMKMDMAESDMGMNISDMQAAVPVSLQTVEPGTVAMSVNYTGTVKPFLEETIYPRVEGYLLELPLYPGDRVSTGQVVGRLDDKELGQIQARSEAAAAAADSRTLQARADSEAVKVGVEVAKAELEAAQKTVEKTSTEIYRAKVDLDYWHGVLEREKELFQAEAVAQEELDEKESRYAAAKAMHHNTQVELERDQAQVKAKQAAVDRARRQVSASEAAVGANRSQERVAALDADVKTTVSDYTVLRSNISGVVTERIIDPGVLVRPGMGLLKVAQMNQVRLQFTVAEEDLRYIHKGTPITVTSQALKRPFEAMVSSLFHAVDARSRTGIVEAVVDNPEGNRLLPGSYVVGDFALRTERDVLWVPRGAVGTYYKDASVWVATKRADQLVAVRRTVRTGAEDEARIEIADGLSSGDQVIVAGHHNLVEGAPIISAGYGEGIYDNLLLPKKADSPSENMPNHAGMKMP